MAAVPVEMRQSSGTVKGTVRIREGSTVDEYEDGCLS